LRLLKHSAFLKYIAHIDTITYHYDTQRYTGKKGLTSQSVCILAYSFWRCGRKSNASLATPRYADLQMDALGGIMRPHKTAYGMRDEQEHRRHTEVVSESEAGGSSHDFWRPFTWELHS
jgi:hypothetical protein